MESLSGVGKASTASASEVQTYESGLDPAHRKKHGIHYTPVALAQMLVENTLELYDGVPDTVCDPTCGTGVFLVAAADALTNLGLATEEIVTERIHGCDRDPIAISLARERLVSWAHERGVTVDQRRLTNLIVADPLRELPSGWGRDTSFDLIVGNPPFLGQLRRVTSRDSQMRNLLYERFGELSPYTDTAAVFILVALEILGSGGLATLIQPQSFLSSRDGSTVRAMVGDSAELVELWSSDQALFDAAVRVCAVTLRSGAPPDSSRQRNLTVRWGASLRQTFEHEGECVTEAVEGRSWGPYFAPLVGIPRIQAHGGLKLGDIARVTAGFRDEYYGMVAALLDGNEDPLSDASGAPRLATTGMIDPMRITWGSKARRIAGSMRSKPRLDLELLAMKNPKVHAWASSRMVPKVLVATQSHVVEAAPDPTASYVPVTPLISVEPVAGWGKEILDEPAESEPDLWWIVAALSAPSVTAYLSATQLGTGLSAGTIRFSAKTLLQVELPLDVEAWALGASAARRLANCKDEDVEDALGNFGSIMCRAHMIRDGSAVNDWWMQRMLRVVRKSTSATSLT